MMYLLLFLLGLFVPLPTTDADAATCTNGTDCYAACVIGPATVGNFKNSACQTKNVPVDTAYLMVEGFDSPSLTTDFATGGGSPNYGPWYDNTTGGASDPLNMTLQGFTSPNLGGFNRGANSWWNQTYGFGPGFNNWKTGEPTPGGLGVTCNATGFLACSGSKAYDVTNRWSANSYSTGFAFFTAPSNFSSELGSLIPPSGIAGGGNGCFDGNSCLTKRWGVGDTKGIFGSHIFGRGSTQFRALPELGMTMAVAHSSNFTAAGLWGTPGNRQPVKYNEWDTPIAGFPSGGCHGEGPFIFWNGSGPWSVRPFSGFLGVVNGSGCGNLTYTGSINFAVGSGFVQGPPGSIVWWASPTVYDHDRDWPDGTYACIQGDLSGLGTSTARHRTWITPTAGPNAGIQLLISDFTFDATCATNINNCQGYSGLEFDSYANTNQGTGGVPSSQVAYITEDNIHVRAGPPVSCAQIGFTGGGAPDTTPPAVPTGLGAS